MQFDSVRENFTSLRHELNARFATVDARFDGMDRGIQLVVTKVFGTDEGRI